MTVSVQHVPPVRMPNRATPCSPYSALVGRRYQVTLVNVSWWSWDDVTSLIVVTVIAIICAKNNVTAFPGRWECWSIFWADAWISSTPVEASRTATSSSSSWWRPSLARSQSWAAPGNRRRKTYRRALFAPPVEKVTFSYLVEGKWEEQDSQDLLKYSLIILQYVMIF